MLYAGIGSRETPEYILGLMEATGTHLAKMGYILRSGAAKGADSAFEKGCDAVAGKKEIYLPWKGFEGSSSNLIVEDPKAFLMAEKYHPYWHNLKQGGKRLQARNCHQVLGLDLNTPIKFLLCYTKGGSGQGGTGQAIRIAKDYQIPVFDMGSYSDNEELRLAFINFFNNYVY